MTSADRCPICKRAIPSDPDNAAYRPFCSRRCRLVDLGSWLDGAYRITRPVSEEDLDQGETQGAGEEDESS